MLSYLLPILVILMLNTLPLQVFKRKFGEVLPITFISIPVILFVTQFIFKTFTVGIILICVLALAGTVLLFIRRKHFSDYFSNGFFVLLAVFLIILIIDFHRSFSDFDEFWHWGPMVKEMLRLDRFYCIDASRMVIHKDYPPFPALYELFISIVGLSYNEGAINAGLHIMCFSVLAASVSEKVSFANKKIIKALVFGVSLCVLLLAVFSIFDVPGITLTILADFPIAAFFALAVFLVLSGDAYESAAGFVSFALSCVMRTMTKQAGLPIMLVAVFLFFLVGLAEKKKFLKTLGFSAISVALPMAFYLGWSKYVSSLGVSDIRTGTAGNGQFSLSKINLRTYLDVVLQKTGGGIQESTFRDYVKALADRKITISGFSVSYVTAFLIVIVLLVIIAILFKNEFKPRKAVATGVALTVGTIGYAFLLSILFVFCFTEDEMLELRGFERYVDSYVAGEVVTLLLIIILLLSKKKNLFEKSRYIILAAMISVILLGTNASRIVPGIVKSKPYTYRDAADDLSASTEPDSCITLVCDNAGYWYGYIHAYVGYYLNDRDFPLDLDLYHEAGKGHDILADLTKRVKDSSQPNYLYVLNTNDALNNALAPYTGMAALTENTVYKVSVDKNGALHVDMVR